MDESLEYFLTQFTPLPHALPFREETLEKYQGRLPNQLLTYWRELGQCGFNKGSFWLVDPDDYIDLIDVLLQDKTTFHPSECIVFARSGLGHLHIWCERIGTLYISVAELKLCFGAPSLMMITGKREMKVGMHLASVQPSNMPNIDIIDDDGKFLIKRAQKDLGPLKVDECYGFFPALPMGGSRRIENLKKVKLHEHLMMIAQMDTLRVYDVDQFPPKQVE